MNPISILGISSDLIKSFSQDELRFFDFLDSMLKAQLRFFAPDADNNQDPERFKQLAEVNHLMKSIQDPEQRRESIRLWMKDVKLDPQNQDRETLLRYVMDLMGETAKQNSLMHRARLEEVIANAFASNNALFVRDLEQHRLLIDYNREIAFELRFTANDLLVFRLKPQKISKKDFQSDNDWITGIQGASLSILRKGELVSHKGLRPIAFMNYTDSEGKRIGGTIRQTPSSPINQVRAQFLEDRITNCRSFLIKPKGSCLVMMLEGDGGVKEFFISGSITGIKKVEKP